MASHPSTTPRPTETSSGAFWMFAAMILGLTVAVVGFFALLMWADARQARDDAAQPAAASSTTDSASAEATSTAGQDHATDHNVALPLNSFAGVVPENATELAEAHKPYDATLPPLTNGDVVKVNMVMKRRPSRSRRASSTTSGPSTASSTRRARSSTSARGRRSSSR